MIKNCYHNLIHQLSETMDSLWRMDTYIEDARNDGCQEDIEFWQRFKETLEEQVEMLKEKIEEMIRSHSH